MSSSNTSLPESVHILATSSLPKGWTREHQPLLCYKKPTLIGLWWNQASKGQLRTLSYFIYWLGTTHLQSKGNQNDRKNMLTFSDEPRTLTVATEMVCSSAGLRAWPNFFIPAHTELSMENRGWEARESRLAFFKTWHSLWGQLTSDTCTKPASLNAEASFWVLLSCAIDSVKVDMLKYYINWEFQSILYLLLKLVR